MSLRDDPTATIRTNQKLSAELVERRNVRKGPDDIARVCLEHPSDWPILADALPQRIVLPKVAPIVERDDGKRMGRTQSHDTFVIRKPRGAKQRCRYRRITRN